MRIYLFLIISICMISGCSSRVDEIKKKQLIEENYIRKKQNIRPEIVNLLQKYNINQLRNNNNDDVVVLVAEYKNDYLITAETEEKCELLAAIAELDKINTIGFFINALSDPESRIRQEAAIQMKSMVVNLDVINALIVALDDNDDDVLIEVIEALSGVYDRRVLIKLTTIAEAHSDQLIRDVALDYAQKMKGVK